VPPRTAPLGIKTTVAASELSLGAMFAAFAREDGHLPPHVQGEGLRDRLFTWAEGLARPSRMPSTFGSGPIRLAAERRVTEDQAAPPAQEPDWPPVLRQNSVRAASG
jgi:hypothetical protein